MAERWRFGRVSVAILLLLLVAAGLSALLSRPSEEAPPAEVTGPLGPDHNCRFWGAASPAIPDSLIQANLIDDIHSIENLSFYMHNGWCVMHVTGSEGSPVVDRGQPPAIEDPLFDLAVAAAIAADPTIAISHVRYCSSGLCDIPNPHPFTRVKNGRHWFLGHNGTVDKEILVSLIRPEYLAANPPLYGENIEEWIDSELYFLYFLQCCEDRNWDVEQALADVVQNLRLRIPGNRERLNIIFTNGETLWAYREGITLYYLTRNAGPGIYTAIASIYPTAEQEDWVEMEDGDLLSVVPGYAPRVDVIDDFFDPTGFPHGTPALTVESAGLSAHPNPFNPSTRLAFTLAEPADVALTIYDPSGRRVRSLLADERFAAGEHEQVWLGRDDAGRPLPSGVYLGRLSADGRVSGARLVLLK